VKASPSTSAGHPPALKTATSASSVALSVILEVSPSKMTSMPSSRTEIVQAGFAARLRDFRVPGPLVK
jgi:hypothetical protein